jgi:hypothetical protein
LKISTKKAPGIFPGAFFVSHVENMLFPLLKGEHGVHIKLLHPAGILQQYPAEFHKEYQPPGLC